MELRENISREVLKKGNGDVFCEIGRSATNTFIYVSWIGVQSIETMVMGGNRVLAMLRVRSCPAVLTSNRELVGPWDSALSWLVHKWAPQAKELGVSYYAHVLSHGIFGKRSFDKLRPELEPLFAVTAFEEEAPAEKWIHSKFAKDSPMHDSL